MCGSNKVNFIVKFNLFVFKLTVLVVGLDGRYAFLWFGSLGLIYRPANRSIWKPKNTISTCLCWSEINL